MNNIYFNFFFYFFRTGRRIQVFFFFSSRRRHTRSKRDWSSDVCSSDLVPETMNLLRLLKSLQRQQRGLAIVLDEFGGTAGIVTMEDILEEMIGKIRDEIESEGFIMEKLGPGRWRVSGS